MVSAFLHFFFLFLTKTLGFLLSKHFSQDWHVRVMLVWRSCVIRQASCESHRNLIWVSTRVTTGESYVLQQGSHTCFYAKIPWNTVATSQATQEGRPTARSTSGLRISTPASYELGNDRPWSKNITTCQWLRNYGVSFQRLTVRTNLSLQDLLPVTTRLS